MREIKIRFWSGRKMFYKPEQVIEYLKQQSSGIYDHEKNGGIFEQFTGLRDKNGREIYEGDIIECEYYSGLATTKGYEKEDLTWRGVVKWGSDASFHVQRFAKHKNGLENLTNGCYAVRYGGSAVKRWEVIGNIHENTELLCQ